MSFILHVKEYWSFAERANVMGHERRYAARNGVEPLDLWEGPPPRKLTFDTRQAAERHALMLKARHGANVATCITEHRKRARRVRPMLADWPRQRAPR